MNPAVHGHCGINSIQVMTNKGLCKAIRNFLEVAGVCVKGEGEIT